MNKIIAPPQFIFCSKKKVHKINTKNLLYSIFKYAIIVLSRGAEKKKKILFIKSLLDKIAEMCYNNNSEREK